MKISFALAALAVIASVTAYTPYHHKKPHYGGHKPVKHHGYKPTKPHHGYKPHHAYKPHHGYKPHHTYKGLQAASIPAEANVAFTSCSSTSAAVVLKGLALNPSPPSKSSPLTVTTYGDVNVVVNLGAKLHVVASIGGTAVLTQDYDLCNASTVCPIQTGSDRAFASTLPVPDNLPPFTDIVIKGTALNADGSELFCLQTTVNFQP